jgi:hypothetical protein
MGFDMVVGWLLWDWGWVAGWWGELESGEGV